MIRVTEATEIVYAQTVSLGSEKIGLANSTGRVLAEDIIADTDLPPFDRSQMDGFALRAGDTATPPVTLKIAGESAAGRGWHREIKKGEAVRIMTGAPVPKGADAVQKVEATSEASFVSSQEQNPKTPDTVTILETAQKGKFIVRQGAEIKKGATVFRAGETITAQTIAALAAFGYAKVRVAKQPRVAILATGSEIVSIEKKPGRDQIRNSNSVMLKALCENSGAVAETLPTVGDKLADLVSQISQAAGPMRATAAKSHILIITGGVSVGKYDLTKAALRELGAEIFFERLRLKPGKPTVFAKLDNTLIFGLPGNPVSVAATYYLFVRLAIRLMQGASDPKLKEGFAVLSHAVKAAKERDTCLPAALNSAKDGTLRATPLKWLGSSDFIGFTRSDAFIVIPKGKSIEAGEIVKILFL